jgi:hypothetical protein
MSVFRFACPFCQGVLQGDDTTRGKQVRCPRCQNVFAVPTASASRDAGWYVARHKQKVGPYTTTQLRQLAANGQLRPVDMILGEGQIKWVPAGSVPGLFPATSPPAAAAIIPAAPLPTKAPIPPALAAPRRAAPAATTGRMAAARAVRPPMRRALLPWLVGGAALAVVVLAFGALFLIRFFAISELPEQTTQGVAAVVNEKAAAQPVEVIQAKPAPVEQKLDLSFIAADFNGAVVLNPRRIVQSPVVARALPDNILEEMVKETGIDPRKVEQAMVLFDPLPAPAKEPPPKQSDKKGPSRKEYTKPPPTPDVTLRDALIGKWDKVGTGEKGSVEFRRDGTATFTTPGVPGMEAKYQLLGGDMVHVEISLPGGKTVPQKLRVKIDKDEMTTTDEENEVDRFRRSAAPPPANKNGPGSEVPAAPSKTSLPIRGSAREQAESWLRNNNAFGPKHRLVTNITQALDRQVDGGKAFFINLGKKLVKSRHPTILAGRNGAFQAFEVAPEQAAKWPDLGTVVKITAAQDEVVEAAPVANLDNLQFDNAARFDGSRNVSGAVTFRQLGAFEGHLALRLTYMVDDLTRTRYYPVDRDPAAGKGTLSFSFPPVHEEGNTTAGPLPVFMELCTFHNPERRGKVVVLSNSVPALLIIAEGASGEEELEEQEAPPGPGNPVDPGPVSPDMPFIPATILRFSEPVDGQAILTKNLGGMQAREFAGKKYFLSQSQKQGGMPLAGHLAGDRTLLVAPEPTLHKMLAANDSKSPLLDRVRKIDPDNEATGVFLLEPYVRRAGPFLQMAAVQLPPDLAAVKTVADQLKAATVMVNLRNDTLLQLVLESETADSAIALQKLVTAGLAMARKVHPQVREALAGQLPPGAAQPVLAVADALNEGISVTQDAERVTIRLRRPANLLPAEGAAKGK